MTIFWVLTFVFLTQKPNFLAMSRCIAFITLFESNKAFSFRLKCFKNLIEYPKYKLRYKTYFLALIIIIRIAKTDIIFVNLFFRSFRKVVSVITLFVAVKINNIWKIFIINNFLTHIWLLSYRIFIYLLTYP